MYQIGYVWCSRVKGIVREKHCKYICTCIMNILHQNLTHLQIFLFLYQCQYCFASNPSAAVMDVYSYSSSKVLQQKASDVGRCVRLSSSRLELVKDMSAVFTETQSKKRECRRDDMWNIRSHLLIKLVVMQLRHAGKGTDSLLVKY